MLRKVGKVGRGGYGVHYRTLGNVGYFICSLNTRGEVLRDLEDGIWTAVPK
jgi:dethiobiotin synthetase/adenosylmethionine--8-amino-7-oxononanoate aminotransferase